VQSNQGKADLARAEQQAAQIQALARAEAEKVRMLGEGEARKIAALASAEAERAARVGIAQAMAIEEQVRAYGGPRFQLTQQVMAPLRRGDRGGARRRGAEGGDRRERPGNGSEPGLGGSTILEGCWRCCSPTASASTCPPRAVASPEARAQRATKPAAQSFVAVVRVVGGS
jgi:hypothetical protein